MSNCFFPTSPHPKHWCIEAQSFHPPCQTSILVIFVRTLHPPHGQDLQAPRQVNARQTTQSECTAFGGGILMLRKAGHQLAWLQQACFGWLDLSCPPCFAPKQIQSSKRLLGVPARSGCPRETFGEEVLLFFHWIPSGDRPLHRSPPPSEYCSLEYSIGK